MDIAQNKRRENIAEYILYLWQLEDLMRALQFSPEAIFSQLIKPRKLSPAKSEELLVWYLDVANLLREQGCEESGHLEHTMHLIGDLQTLHTQLITLPVGVNYRKLFALLAPELTALRELIDQSDSLNKSQVSDIELCFRALYAAMLYRIKDDEQGKQSISDVLEVVSPVIAELSHVFHQIEMGEIDLFATN